MFLDKTGYLGNCRFFTAISAESSRQQFQYVLPEIVRLIISQRKSAHFCCSNLSTLIGL